MLIHWTSDDIIKKDKLVCLGNPKFWPYEQKLNTTKSAWVPQTKTSVFTNGLFFFNNECAFTERIKKTTSTIIICHVLAFVHKHTVRPRANCRNRKYIYSSWHTFQFILYMCMCVYIHTKKTQTDQEGTNVNRYIYIYTDIAFSSPGLPAQVRK